MTCTPLVKELTPMPELPQALRGLADWPGLVLFDSALPRGDLGRYSFLAAEPFETFITAKPDYGSDPFHGVREALGGFEVTPIEGLPPFQGGAAGLLGYDLGRCWERLPLPRWNEFEVPAGVIGLYDWVLAWDHRQRRCWFISHALLGRPRAEERLARVEQALEPFEGAAGGARPQSPPEEVTLSSGSCPPVLSALSAPCRPLGPAGILSNFSRDEYLAAVQRVIDDIHAGDIFQANLSQRLLARARLPAVEQYLRLRQENPAPFAGFFAFEDWAVLSSSPERFVQLSGGEVVTRPIKGTRQRRPVPEADLYTRDELRESEKDQAENVMIVDLLRNDLSRVCRPGSIRVPELCTVEAYETVAHLVSEVRGRLRDGATFWDLLAAAFPGGSITGAPKVRAMEIITEMEQVTRGPYCGSLMYCGFDGTADSNILIRTMTRRGGWLQFPVGGGIVAQSRPEEEYEETLHKARGLLRALPRENEETTPAP